MPLLWMTWLYIGARASAGLDGIIYLALVWRSGPHFKIKTVFLGIGITKDEMVVRAPDLYNGSFCSYPGKTASLYWNGPRKVCTHFMRMMLHLCQVMLSSKKEKAVWNINLIFTWLVERSASTYPQTATDRQSDRQRGFPHVINHHVIPT